MSKLVKLHLHMHQSEETVVDIFEARDWGEFLIVKVNIPEMTSELYDQVVAVLRESIPDAGVTKQVVLIPANWDLEFYGIEVDPDDQRRL